jgi:hypothetical protein
VKEGDIAAATGMTGAAQKSADRQEMIVRKSSCSRVSASGLPDGNGP